MTILNKNLQILKIVEKIYEKIWKSYFFFFVSLQQYSKKID